MSTRDAERLAAGLDEDEHWAHMAEAGWPPRDVTVVASDPERYPLMPTEITPSKAAFILRNDPARIRRDIAAKRRILADYEQTAVIAASVPGDGTPARDVLDAQRELCALANVIAALAAVYEEAGEEVR